MAPAAAKDHHLVLHGDASPKVGQTCVVFSDNGEKLVSCGANGVVCLREGKSKERKEGWETVKASTASEGMLKNGACNVLAYHPSGFVAVGGEHAVKAVSLPSMEVERTLGRTQLPVRALSFSPDGARLAVGGDAENIRLIQTKDSAVTRQLRCEGYVRSVAWDPEGAYVAATMADGSLCVFEAGTGKLQARKKVLRKVDRASAARCCVDWHPDGGALLAVAGSADGDVALYERLSWDVSSYLGGGHRGPANVVAFSPNGLYAATGGEDACVCVWDVSKQTVISKAVTGPASEKDENSVSPGTGSTISSIAWQPTGNSLAVADESGRVGVWEEPVPARLPSPTSDLEHVRNEGGARKGKGSKAAQAAGASLIDDQAGEDYDEGGDSAGGLGEDGNMSEGGSSGGDGHEPEQRGKRPREEAEDEDEEEGDGEEEVEAQKPGPRVKQHRAGGGGDFVRLEAEMKRAMRMIRSQAASVPMPPQDPIHPGSTPLEATTGSCGARFLAYNMEGCIISRPVDDHNVVELQFHDAGRANAMGLGRVPLLTDFFGFTMGALGERGVLYGSPMSSDSPSMLVYRPFEEWAPNGSWSVGLPAGESVECVAAGATFSAAATNSQLLRLFSVSGMQSAIVSLQGAVVALAAQEHLLAVVTHSGAPSCSGQSLELAVYDVPSSTCLLSGPCPLSHKATLTWIGFTDEGMVATADSAGIIRIRSHSMGGAWLPVWSSATASKSGEVYWPVAIRSQELCSIMCPKHQPYPSVNPRPFFTRLPLQVPVLSVEGGAPALEAELMLTSLRIDSARLRSETAMGLDAVHAADELVGRQAEADRSLLKIFQAALKSDRQARAMDIVPQLSQHRSLEGALKLANFHRASAVAERVALILQQVDAQNQDLTVTPLPPPKGNIGGRAPEPLGEHDTNAPGDAPGSNPPSSGGGGQLTALKQLASDPTPTPNKGGGQNENKRKPPAAGLGAAAHAAGSMPNNPFARRPTKAAKH